MSDVLAVFLSWTDHVGVVFAVFLSWTDHVSDVFSAPVAGAASNLVAPMVRAISSKLVKQEEEGQNLL